jgi:hypothetical protein
MLVISNTLNRKVKAAAIAVGLVVVAQLGLLSADVLQDQPLLLGLVSAAIPVVTAYLTKMSREDVTGVKPDVDTKDNVPFDLGD